jgi:chromate transporter
VSLGLLFALLLKASVTSFSGLGALPQLRQDLVVTHRAIDDDQLSRAVLLGRSSPGPIGIYVVSVGYAVRGVPGAIVGWIALALPAFLAVPLLVVLRRWLHQPRLRSAVDAVVIGGATLLVPSAVALLRDAYVQLHAILA